MHCIFWFGFPWNTLCAASDHSHLEWQSSFLWLTLFRQVETVGLGKDLASLHVEIFVCLFFITELARGVCTTWKHETSEFSVVYGYPSIFSSCPALFSDLRTAGLCFRAAWRSSILLCLWSVDKHMKWEQEFVAIVRRTSVLLIKLWYQNTWNACFSYMHVSVG